MSAIADGARFHNIIQEAGVEKLAHAVEEVVKKKIATYDYPVSAFQRRICTSNILKELKRANPPVGTATSVLTELGLKPEVITNIVQFH